MAHRHPDAPVHLSQVQPIATLIAATESLRKRNDKLDAELRKERGSVPPSAPSQPVTLTPERAAEIGKLLISSIAVMTAATLVGLSASEFVAFCRRAAK